MPRKKADPPPPRGFKPHTPPPMSHPIPLPSIPKIPVVHSPCIETTWVAVRARAFVYYVCSYIITQINRKQTNKQTNKMIIKKAKKILKPIQNKKKQKKTTTNAQRSQREEQHKEKHLRGKARFAQTTRDTTRRQNKWTLYVILILIAQGTASTHTPPPFASRARGEYLEEPTALHINKATEALHRNTESQKSLKKHGTNSATKLQKQQQKQDAKEHTPCQACAHPTPPHPQEAHTSQ